MAQWDPEKYLRFEDERTQPARDLAARINLASPASIIDLGCGPGNSTRVLRQKWPASRITGLDNSVEMIEKARKAYPDATWILADLAAWQPDDSYDLVFSNATLHWLQNHERLLPALFAGVKMGGALAVQVPANHHSPLVRSVVKTSQQPPWRETMAGCSSLINYRSPEYYYDLLSGLAEAFSVWTTTYYHVMQNHQSLIDWYASTGLRPYLDRLSDDAQRAAFQAEVLDGCRSDYPWQQDGKILFPFQRVFFVAYK